jgi:hypothetical protein
VALVGADAVRRLVDGETLLVAAGDDRRQPIAGQCRAVGVEGLQQVRYGHPTVAVERDADPTGVVAEHECEQLRHPNVVHRGTVASP